MKTGSLGRVTQRVTEPLYGCIEALIEVDVRIGGPERLPKLFTSDQLSGTPQQKSENLGGLARETHTPALLEELSRFEVEFENTESNHRTQKR